MPCFSRTRLFVPTLILLSSAALVTKGDESIPAALPAAIDAEPLSESGVRLAQLLEDDADEPEVPRAPDDVSRLTRLDHDQATSMGAMPILTVRNPAPFNLLQAALLTFTAGGATGGIWFAISRLHGLRPLLTPPIVTPQSESSAGDLLSRVIAGNVPVLDEAPEPFDISRIFGCAVPSSRYCLQVIVPEVSPQFPQAVTAEAGPFHRVSEGVAEVEPPHFQSRQPAGSPVVHQATSGGETA